jgi:23S rRNA (cytidine1920-2'-O)/16S rRNA (cytidine1409-2'-O)-methyltransferase
LLPVIRGWFENEVFAETSSGQLIALIKPQFEAGRAETAHGDGVIRNPDVHQRILSEVLVFAQNIGFCVRGLIRSPLLGPKGNVEFLAWMEIGEPGTGSLATLIESALQSGDTKNTQ